MDRLQISILLSILSLMLVTLSHTATLPEAARPRAKRQSADVRTAEYLAWIALGGDLRQRGCDKVACGVVDVYTRTRAKRQSADIRMAEILALMALQGSPRKTNCDKVACGVVDIYARVRRSSADQRVAELQALLALSQGRSRGSYRIAHGQFDPNAIGKRKRSDLNNQELADGSNMSEDERYSLLKAIITKAAMGHTA